VQFAILADNDSTQGLTSYTSVGRAKFLIEQFPKSAASKAERMADEIWH
jgi:hypothetical protein